jgi:hypothetical protein
MLMLSYVHNLSFVSYREIFNIQNKMYHKELEIKETTETAFSSSFRHFLTFKYDTNGLVNILLLVQYPEPLYGLLLYRFVHGFWSWSWLHPFSGFSNTVALWKSWKTRFTHPGYRSENIQRNLEKMYGTKLRFIRMDTKWKVINYRYCFL